MRFILLCLVLLASCSSNNIDSFSRPFVGVRYVNSPLGEEKEPDIDPLMRFDAFDCTTFVETVLAGGEVEKLNKIRYKNGEVSFVNRNHFIETDWLKNNSDVVENVSEKFAKTDIRTVVIDKQSWFKIVHGVEVEAQTETVQLKYIPYANIEKISNKEPLIVLFVADNPKIHDKIGTDLAVVHMGFLLPNGRLRHASSKYKQVVDVDFYDYVKQQQSETNIGIILVAIK